VREECSEAKVAMADAAELHAEQVCNFSLMIRIQIHSILCAASTCWSHSASVQCSHAVAGCVATTLQLALVDSSSANKNPCLQR
jgi:hypothetical protein